MLLIQTALKWGWSPSALIRNARNPRKHHSCDYALAIAYELVDSEKCGGCGTPSYWAFSEDSAITFELEEVTCWACNFKATESKDKDLTPGTQVVVKAVAEEDCVLPGRAEFVQAQIKKAARKKAKEETSNSD